METTVTYTYERASMLELIGIFPIAIALLAIVLGIAALAKRKRHLNHLFSAGLLAIAFAGFGKTALMLCESFNVLGSGGALDPVELQGSLGLSFLPLVVILPACSIGYLLVAFAWGFTREPRFEDERHATEHLP